MDQLHGRIKIVIPNVKWKVNTWENVWDRLENYDTLLNKIRDELRLTAWKLVKNGINNPVLYNPRSGHVVAQHWAEMVRWATEIRKRQDWGQNLKSSWTLGYENLRQITKACRDEGWPDSAEVNEQDLIEFWWNWLKFCSTFVLVLLQILGTSN